MTWPQLELGSKVYLKVDAVPYYSGYAGNPKVLIKAGTVGVVGAVDVPPVCCPRGERPISFACVDFHLPGMFQGNPEFNHCTWRVAVRCDQMTLFFTSIPE